MSSTLILIAITTAVSLLAFSNPKLLLELLFWPPALRRGEYQRLLTHGFVHKDTTHLLFNMLTLYFFGSHVEKFYQAQLGEFGFAFFYVLGIPLAILPSWWRHRNDEDYRSLGASGAVLAVLFASILFDPWSTLLLFFVLPVPAIVFAVGYVAYSIWSDLRGGGGVNHNAHLWGAAYGVAFTVLLEPRVWGQFLQRLLEPGLH
ncbi:MAG: rhomboid family intramembrane serine protease [Arenimonas sp.]